MADWQSALSERVSRGHFPPPSYYLTSLSSSVSPSIDWRMYVLYVHWQQLCSHVDAPPHAAAIAYVIFLFGIVVDGRGVAPDISTPVHPSVRPLDLPTSFSHPLSRVVWCIPESN